MPTAAPRTCAPSGPPTPTVSVRSTPVCPTSRSIFGSSGRAPRLSDREVERFTNVDYVNRVALIATIGTEMVAVIRYDRTGPGEAEVAFLVEDAHQGRGVASVLLEHLAATARERGIERFIADVLPANMRMTGLLRQAGYTAQSQFEDGVVRMTLDLTPPPTPPPRSPRPASTAPSPARSPGCSPPDPSR
ncbi:hypothetical protein GCM10020001_018700 [Nonomuraea salmonea]